MTSTGNYSAEITRLKKAIADCEAVVVGAGAGLSTAAGLTYSGARFEDNFSDFEEKYGFHDMYSGGFFPFATSEEKWAYWSRFIYLNRYTEPTNQTYKKLLELISGKDYFVITTNVDHQFQKAGFDKDRLFYTQGDYGLFQCSVPCHNKTYDNEQLVRKMYETQRDMKIPSELVPVCPVCGREMSMNLRSDDSFVEDEGWNNAYVNYQNFLSKVKDKKVLYLELGVGYNTPVIIKYPFWQMTKENKNALYACINKGEGCCPQEILEKAIIINSDIHSAICSCL